MLVNIPVFLNTYPKYFLTLFTFCFKSGPPSNFRFVPENVSLLDMDDMTVWELQR